MTMPPQNAFVTLDMEFYLAVALVQGATDRRNDKCIHNTDLEQESGWLYLLITH